MITGAILILVGICIGYFLRGPAPVSRKTLRLIKRTAKIIDTSPEIDLGEKDI
jgi:hypothetical protein